ncbi:MAG TPA: nuclease domain-containing protein [Planctomycetaceae bacterium]|jgi:hypothetical protein
MTTFAIQYGPTPVCTWDIDTGHVTFHERAARRENVLIVEELDKFAFVLSPAPVNCEHRIFIGDVPLHDLIPSQVDSAGVALGGHLFWRDLAYFESARGPTKILVESQADDSPTDCWAKVLLAQVYVLPTKLGEERYLNMTGDLSNLSRSLLIDLYGKSDQTHDVRFAKEGRAYHSCEQELASIESTLGHLSVLLSGISERPSSKIVNLRFQQTFWGSERLSPSAISLISRRGAAFITNDRPIVFNSRRNVESFDIAEHRVIRAFLCILLRRARYCATVARDHIRAIVSEQKLRNVRFANKPTLYEMVDMPKIRRLEDAIRKAYAGIALATKLADLQFLQGVPPELVASRDGVFQRSPEYKAVFLLIRRFLLDNAVWYQGDSVSTVTKLTSRLFEQWCFLRIVDAFRAAGLELREWTDALRDNLRSRFILDFDRGLLFEGKLTETFRLRFRYEPWILGEESAAIANETLCRGSLTDVPWSPDIVIECLREDTNGLRTVYGIVLDCKYTKKIKSQHWNATAKYQQIRSTGFKQQVIRQLWLVAPSDYPEITSEDPAIRFGENGPTCAANESVQFCLTVAPAVSQQGTGEPLRICDTFEQFAKGTLRFLQREIVTSDQGRI